MTGELCAPAIQGTEATRSIAIIRFNRPAELNPLSMAALDQLKTTLSAGWCNASV
jgi:enoyl-CoA hydratase/carnithine racemase